MANAQQLMYWDSCVFLAYMNNEQDHVPTIDAFLEGVAKSNGKKKIVTSILAKVEVAVAVTEKNTNRLSDDVEEKIDALWADSSVLELIELHDGIATEARTLIRRAVSRGWSLKPADAIHLATAIQVGVFEFHTYDLKD
jgi:hypothetical protein